MSGGPWAPESGPITRGPRRRSHEVVARAPAASRYVPLVIGHGGEDTELGVQVCIDCHNGSHIAASVTVVGRRPDCHNGLLREVVLTENVSLVKSPKFIEGRLTL